MIQSIVNRVQLWRFGPIDQDQRPLNGGDPNLRTIKNLLWVLVTFVVIIPAVAGLVLLAVANR
jgi:hypothetical protein